jgi:hypothetical protein
MSAGLTTSEIPKLDKASRSVAWWSVNAYVEPLLAAVVQWPMAGTPEWCELPENDARKIAAIYDAARHHALRVESSQAARAEASRDISDAADWYAVAREINQRAEFYAARPWLKRVVA